MTKLEILFQLIRLCTVSWSGKFSLCGKHEYKPEGGGWGGVGGGMGFDLATRLPGYS